MAERFGVLFGNLMRRIHSRPKFAEWEADDIGHMIVMYSFSGKLDEDETKTLKAALNARRK